MYSPDCSGIQASSTSTEFFFVILVLSDTSRCSIYPVSICSACAAKTKCFGAYTVLWNVPVTYTGSPSMNVFELFGLLKSLSLCFTRFLSSSNSEICVSNPVYFLEWITIFSVVGSKPSSLIWFSSIFTRRFQVLISSFMSFNSETYGFGYGLMLTFERDTGDKRVLSFTLAKL